MNKILPLIGAGIIGVVLPVAGLSITPTREALLSLTTPDEKILALADKIDENRVSSEATDSKITELQSTIDAQQAKLAEQQQATDEQKTVNADNQKIAKCAELRAKSNYCNRSEFKKSYSDYIELVKSNLTDDDWNSEKEKAENYYKNCQNLFSQCD